MFWDEKIPRRRFTDAGGRGTVVTIIAGALEGIDPLPPPPESWAANDDADVAIWSMAMDAGATWTVPPARGANTIRTLNLFSGEGLRVAGSLVPASIGVQLQANRPVEIEAVKGPVEILLLQGRPIGEPVAQHGPFVMNSRAELETAFDDYRRTQFGGWPWPADAPVFPRAEGRFARHGDGRVERAGGVPSESSR